MDDRLFQVGHLFFEVLRVFLGPRHWHTTEWITLTLFGHHLRRKDLGLGWVIEQHFCRVEGRDAKFIGEEMSFSFRVKSWSGLFDGWRLGGLKGCQIGIAASLDALRKNIAFRFCREHHGGS